MPQTVHIRYVRSGGLGGLRMLADVDTGQRDKLGDDVAKQLEQLSSDVLSQPVPTATPTKLRDGFQYDLTFESAGKSHNLRASEPIASAQLQQLIEILDGFAAPAKRG